MYRCVETRFRADVQYVEFDEEHVFICSMLQVQVYSRRTRSHLVSFPPNPEDIYESASTVFALDMLNDVEAVPRAARDSVPVGRAELKGVSKGDGDWKRMMERGTEGGLVRQRGSDSVAMNFTA